MKDFLSYYNNKKVLVVGAGGHIGSALVEKLSQINCNLTLLYRSNPEKQPTKGKVVVLDVTKPEIWPELLEQAEIIFYLAAHESNKIEPELDLQVNALSVLHLLEAARQKQVFPKIVFASSSNLVGITEKQPVNELTKDNPLTIFAIHKLMAEKYLQLYAQEFNIPSIILRLANVYGPVENLNLSLRSTLNKMMYNAVKGNPLKLFANKEKIRDFLFVEDAANAFLAAGTIENPKAEMYVVGTEQGESFVKIVENIAELTLEATGAKPEIITDTEFAIKTVEMRDFVADSTKFKNLTGWESEVDLKMGMEKTINYFKSNGTNS